MLHAPAPRRIIRHAHMFCGLGAGARGFNMAKARVGRVEADFRCTGGIDVDAGAIRNFERLTGTPGTVLDLFSRDQYRAFHGHEPPPGWREATPADVRRALTGPDGIRPDVIFLSAPCKGFSGLLSARQALTDKYQALNALTVRGVMLICEAFADGPIPIILFENVPRIQTRGRPLLDQIAAVLRGHRYHLAETVHDCGHLGGLAQSRKRFLLIARHRDLIPNFIYEPEKRRLRGVGEVIGKLPLPGDPAGGVMHRVPMLQWKTWLRLALVPAGRDWRALNDLCVEDGHLRDYGILPEQDYRDGALGVLPWTGTAGVVIGNQRSPLHGRHSVADPRPPGAGWNGDVLGVRPWGRPSGTVPGRSGPTNGAHAVADPRVAGHPRSVQLGVRAWGTAAGFVTGSMVAGGGPHSVADPRGLPGLAASHPVYRIVAFDETTPSARGAHAEARLGDPRMAPSDYRKTKYKITDWGGESRAVIGASTTGDGAFAVADPRTGFGAGSHTNKLRVIAADATAPTITTSDRVGSGALCVADPRPGYGQGTHGNILCVAAFDTPSRLVTGARHVAGGALSVADPRPAGLSRPDRSSYATQGHYGVVDWHASSYAVPAYAKYDRGHWSVADPRGAFRGENDNQDGRWGRLPAPDERLVARIVALDGTWHRPFTTLDLCALQSIIDPEALFTQDEDGHWHARSPFDLISASDSEKREWIGNAVPSDSAASIGGVIGEAILLAEMGETFTLSEKSIWVSPLRVALAVDSLQAATEMDAGPSDDGGLPCRWPS